MERDRLITLSRTLLLGLALGGCASDNGVEDTTPPFTQQPGAVVADAGATPPATTPVGTPTQTSSTPPAAAPGSTKPPTTTTPLMPVTPTMTPIVDAGIAPDTGVAPTDGGTMTPPSGDCLCRGDAPTEATTMKDGPFKTMSYTSGFKMASGATSSTVWYPTDAKPPFAGVAVVPGFVSPESSIRQWGPFLASHGIVAVTIGVPDLDQPEDRAQKLLGTIEGLKAENARSGSPLMGKIDTSRMAVSGWSMGGGGTLISAARTPALKAAVSFAAWGPTGGKNDKVPVLMFEGTDDILAAGMSEPYYADVPASTPKMLFEVQGAPHEVANSPKNSGGIIGSWGLSWFKVFLEGDERYRQFLTRKFPSICTSKCATNVK